MAAIRKQYLPAKLIEQGNIIREVEHITMFTSDIGTVVRNTYSRNYVLAPHYSLTGRIIENP